MGKAQGTGRRFGRHLYRLRQCCSRKFHHVAYQSIGGADAAGKCLPVGHFCHTVFQNHTLALFQASQNAFSLQLSRRPHGIRDKAEPGRSDQTIGHLQQTCRNMATVRDDLAEKVVIDIGALYNSCVAESLAAGYGGHCRIQMGDHPISVEHRFPYLGLIGIRMSDTRHHTALYQFISHLQSTRKLRCNGPAQNIGARIQKFVILFGLRSAQIGRVLGAALAGRKVRPFDMQPQKLCAAAAIVSAGIVHRKSAKQFLLGGGQSSGDHAGGSMGQMQPRRTLPRFRRTIHEIVSAPAMHMCVHKSVGQIKPLRIHNAVPCKGTGSGDLRDLAIFHLHVAAFHPLPCHQ